MIIAALLISATLASSQGSGVADRDAAPRSVGDVARFEELVRQTDALRSFVAEYVLSKPGAEPRALRIVYEAPDRALITSPGEMYFRLSNGFVDVRSVNETKGSTFAHFAFLQANEERHHHLADTIRTQFPDLSAKWTESGTCGPTLGLKFFEPGESAQGDGRTAEFSFRYTCPSQGRLDWLRDFQKRSDGKPLECERVEFSEVGGTTFVLSMKTGFFESLTRELPAGTASLRLEHLELDSQLEPASFDVPSPGSDWTDCSTQMARAMHAAQTQSLRARVRVSLVRLVSDGALEWSDAQAERLEAVLRVLYSDALALEFEDWITATRKRIDEYATWLGDAFAHAPETAPEASARLEEGELAWRKQLAETLQSARTKYIASLAMDSLPKNDVGRSFLEREPKAAEAAFSASVEKPLLDHFDAELAQVER